MNSSGNGVIALPVRPDAKGQALPPWQRDPRRFPYGLLLVDPWPVGTVAGGLCWFASESGAAEFLRNGLWDVLDDDRMADFPGVRELYQAALARRSDISHDWIEAVSALQDHVMVLWFGRFDALLRGDPGFPQVLLEEYRTEAGLGPSVRTDIEGYLAFLRQYLR